MDKFNKITVAALFHLILQITLKKFERMHYTNPKNNKNKNMLTCTNSEKKKTKYNDCKRKKKSKESD